jgi:hypothetical protein
MLIVANAHTIVSSGAGANLHGFRKKKWFRQFAVLRAGSTAQLGHSPTYSWLTTLVDMCDISQQLLNLLLLLLLLLVGIFCWCWLLGMFDR